MRRRHLLVTEDEAPGWFQGPTAVSSTSDLPGIGSSLPTADQLLGIHYTPSQMQQDGSGT